MKKLMFSLILALSISFGFSADPNWYQMTKTIPAESGGYISTWAEADAVYVAYNDISNQGKVSVKSTEDYINWSQVGRVGFTPNRMYDIELNFPYVSFMNPYINNKILTYEFQRDTWVIIGSNLGKKYSEEQALVKTINGIPYVFYFDAPKSGKVTVAIYTNNIRWQIVSNSVASSYIMNMDATEVVNGATNLYVTFLNYSGLLETWRFTTNVWRLVTNTLVTFKVYNPICTTFSNNLYVMFNRTNANGTLSVVKYNGTNWSYVSRNFVPKANYTSIFANDENLFIAYTDPLTNNYLKVSYLSNGNTFVKYGTNKFVVSDSVTKVQLFGNTNIGVSYILKGLFKLSFYGNNPIPVSSSSVVASSTPASSVVASSVPASSTAASSTPASSTAASVASVGSVASAASSTPTSSSGVSTGFTTFAVTNNATDYIVSNVAMGGNGIIEIVLTRDNIYSTNSNLAPVGTTADWTVNGDTPQGIGLNQYVTWEQINGNGLGIVNWNAISNYACNMMYKVFVNVGQNAVMDNSNYIVTGPFGDIYFNFNHRNTFSDAIKVNQEGYSPYSATRWATLGKWLGDMGSQYLTNAPAYEVIRESDGVVVYSNSSGYWGLDNIALTGSDPTNLGSGEFIYRMDISAVPVGGPYYVAVQGVGRSYSFGVGDVYTTNNATVAFKGLYHQRCGIALQEPYTTVIRGFCHPNHTNVNILDIVDNGSGFYSNALTNYGGVDGRMIEVVGGYHDAGDMDRRRQHIVISKSLLVTFEANKDKFTDSQYNIPESGNGVPDFLDETIWSLRGWQGLQETNGGIRDGAMNGQGVYGKYDASGHDQTNHTYAVSGKLTLNVAGALAQASRLVSPYSNELSVSLLVSATNAFNYFVLNPTNDSPRFHDIIYAAGQLYQRTSNVEYLVYMTNTNWTGTTNSHQFFISTFVAANGSSFPFGGTYPYQYIPLNQGNIAYNGIHIADVLTVALFDYPMEIYTNRTIYVSNVINWADRIVGEVSNQPFQVGVHATMGWGTATAPMRSGMELMFAYSRTTNLKYFRVLSSMADYVLGVNPIGKSWITGLGKERPNNPLSLDSYISRRDGYGIVPGITVYGPSADDVSFRDYYQHSQTKAYPRWDDRPVMYRHHDAWAEVDYNEYTIWETIAPNACLFTVVSLGTN